MINEILMIPDTQIRPGLKEEELTHIDAMANYIVSERPEVIVQIGDWADLPSLSTYEERGSSTFHARNYKEDVEASKAAMRRLLRPLAELQRKQKQNKKKVYKPRRILTIGNHESRVDRAINTNPVQLQGLISIDDLCYKKFGWEVHPFLHIVEVEGVHFSHYFINPDSAMKRVLGGTIDSKLKSLGFSFVMGHQQNFQCGIRYLPNGQCVQGVVCGAYYKHSEEYMGVQGNQSHFRGAVSLKDVSEGRFDLQTLSIKYMEKRYL